ncbi:MAG: glycosyltransferase [Anaerolineae bacterium]
MDGRWAPRGGGLTASVIIPARNAGATLPVCLDALAHQTAREQIIEVIVVNDGSTDNTAEIARQAGAVVLQLPGRGAAAARNLGARRARGDILLFTDADCEPAPDWAEAMLVPFAEPDIVGVKGTYCTRQRELVARFVQMEYEDKYRRMARRRYIDFIDTYSAGYRREVFLQHGGFDESFPRANVEDQELSFRLAAAGHHMVFQPRAVVCHHHAASLSAYLRKKFWIGFWKVKVHLRHPGKAIDDSHTPPVLKAQIFLLGLACLGLLTGILWRPALPAAGLLLVVLLATTIPFSVRVWEKDRAVSLAAPALLLARAGALGLGLAAGILSNLLRAIHKRKA